MKPQKQIEQEFKNRMTFDQALDWFEWITNQIEKGIKVNNI